MSATKKKEPLLAHIRSVEYVPTDELRKRVRKLAMLGVPQNKLAVDLGIDIKTLRKHFSEEIEKGDIESFAAVAGALFHNAVVKQNVIAQIFYLKSRHGWVDRKEINHNHSVGPALTHEERLALLEASPDEGPKGFKMMRGVLDGLAEEVLAEGTEETPAEQQAAAPDAAEPGAAEPGEDDRE